MAKNNLRSSARIENRAACNIAEWLLTRAPGTRSWSTSAQSITRATTCGLPMTETRHGARSGQLRAGWRCGVYAAVDAAIARLLRAAGDDAEITIVSDHGSGGTSRRFSISTARSKRAFCPFVGGQSQRSMAWRLRQSLPARARAAPARSRSLRSGGPLPNRLESSTRFGSIDLARTRVFSDCSNYFPAVHLNLEGPRSARRSYSQREVLSVEVRHAQKPPSRRSAIRGPGAR